MKSSLVKVVKSTFPLHIITYCNLLSIIFVSFNASSNNVAVSVPTILSIVTPSGGIVVEDKLAITVPHVIVTIIVVP